MGAVSGRRGWGASPDDATGDAAELRRTKVLMHPIPGSIDRAAVAAVLQSEYDDERCAVPVRLVGGPVDLRMPGLRGGGMFSRALVVGETVRLVDADPRRASLLIGVTDQVGTVVLGRTQAEAADANGFEIGTFGGPFAFRFTGELWGRAVDFPARVSIAVELWTL